jgi:hypothetical protein
MRGQPTLDTATDSEMAKKEAQAVPDAPFAPQRENKSLKPTVNSCLRSSFDASKRFKAFNNY